MSIEYMTRVWKDTEITNRCTLLIMLTLADYANSEGHAWPSIETVASNARCSVRTVYDELKALAATPRLKIKSGADTHQTNTYILYPSDPATVAGLPCNPARQIAPDPSGSGKQTKTKEVALKGKGSHEEVKLFCAKAGLPESDADWFFFKCEGNGWINGGKPIKNWQFTILAWKAAGYIPSQKTAVKQQSSSGTGQPKWAEIKALEKERAEKSPQLDEWNTILNQDCNRNAENVAIRKALRERVKAIDARLAELRK